MENTVSVIVPVYNGEKYLGHCLNSILSQTYVNWEAILVNDGSTDSSEQICRNYCALDSRFRLISQPNGGVSRARNTGVVAASGRWLMFLDCDDVLALDCMENLTALAEKSGCELCMLSAAKLDFGEKEPELIPLGLNWCDEEELILSGEDFRRGIMSSIYQSNLLEGPLSKLYDRALWQKMGLKFPEDSSYGEDFAANLEYYSRCKGFAFSKKCGYYYNYPLFSDSLSHSQGEKLFELKLGLMELLGSKLEQMGCSSPQERLSYYSYVAVNFSAAFYGLCRSGLSREEKLRLIEQQLDEPLLRLSLERLSFPPPEIKEEFPVMKAGLPEGILEHFSAVREWKKKESLPAQTGPGKLNKAVRRGLLFVVGLCPRSVLARRLTRLERNIRLHGLKYSFYLEFYALKQWNK